MMISYYKKMMQYANGGMERRRNGEVEDEEEEGEDDDMTEYHIGEGVEFQGGMRESERISINLGSKTIRAIL